MAEPTPSVLLPVVSSFLCAELTLVLVRTREFLVLAKNPQQRQKHEQKQVDGGLGRSVLLEAILFVPCSVVLVLLVIRPLVVPMFHSYRAFPASELFAYSLLGCISYGFPFATVRRIVTLIALKTLSSFAAIATAQVKESASADGEA